MLGESVAKTAYIEAVKGRGLRMSLSDTKTFLDTSDHNSKLRVFTTVTEVLVF